MGIRSKSSGGREASAFVLKDSGCEKSVIDQSLLQRIHENWYRQMVKLPKGKAYNVVSASGHDTPVMGTIDLLLRFKSCDPDDEDMTISHTFLVIRGKLTRHIIMGASFLQSDEYKRSENNQFIELKVDPEGDHYFHGSSHMYVPIFYKGQPFVSSKLIFTEANVIQPYESRWCNTRTEDRHVDCMTLYEVADLRPSERTSTLRVQPMMTSINNDQLKVMVINNNPFQIQVNVGQPIAWIHRMDDDVVGNFNLEVQYPTSTQESDVICASLLKRIAEGEQILNKELNSLSESVVYGRRADADPPDKHIAEGSVIEGKTLSGIKFVAKELICLDNLDPIPMDEVIHSDEVSDSERTNVQIISVDDQQNVASDVAHMERTNDDIPLEDIVESTVGAYADLSDTKEEPGDLRDKFKTKDLKPEERDRLLDIAVNYPEVWAKTKLDIGTVPDYYVSLDTDGTVFSDKFRPFPKGTKEIIMTILKKYLQAGIFEIAPQSPYAMNMFLVRKPIPPEVLERDPDARNNAEYYRCLLDGRSLNRVTKGHSLSLGQFEDLFMKIGSAKYVILIDIVSAFFNIKIRQEDRVLTSFYTPIPGVKCMFSVLPQGLKNSQVEFCALINRLFQPIERTTALYVDDVALFGDTFEDVCDTFDKALKILSTNGIKLLPGKTSFLPATIKFVGINWSRDGTLTIPDAKVQAFSMWPTPLNTRRKIQSFCSAVQFFRKFIENLSGLMKPLTNQLRKGEKVVWDDAAKRSFTSIVDALKAHVTLYIPPPGCEYSLHCDASSVACAARLCYKQGEEEKLVACASRTFGPVAMRYSTFHQELIGLVFAIRAFEGWIAFSKTQVNVDCIALTYLSLTKNSTPSILRISIYLSQFGNFTYKHVPSHENMADSLTRNSHQEDEIRSRTLITPLSRAEAEVLLSCIVIPKGHVFTEREVRQLLAAHPLPSAFQSKIKCRCKVIVPPRRLDFLSAGSVDLFEHNNLELERTYSDIRLLSETEIESSVYLEDPKYIHCSVLVCNNADDERREADMKEAVLIAMTDKTLSKDMMKKVQQVDPYCVEKIKELSEGKAKNFYIQDGVLYGKDIHKQIPGFSEPRVVLPKILFNSIMYQNHASPMSGAHGGPKTSGSTIRNRYFYPNLERSMKEYCDNCIWCQMGKDHREPKSISHGNLVAGRPRTLLAIDLAMSFPRLPSGETGVFILTDTFSAFAIAVPIKDKSSESILGAFRIAWVLTMGSPLYIRCDGELGIVGEKTVFNKYCDEHNIKLMPCSSGASWVNGHAEKKVHIIKDQLRALKAHLRPGQSWRSMLENIIEVNNNTVKSGRFTPNEIQFGEKISAFDVMLTTNTCATLNDYMDNRIEAHEQVIAIHKAHLLDKFEKMVAKYNVGKKEKQFVKGDLVWLKNIKIPSETGNALRPKFLGPYKILDITHKLTALIMNMHTGSIFNRHFNFLKPVKFNIDKRLIPSDLSWDIDLTAPEPSQLRKSARQGETKVIPKKSDKKVDLDTAKKVEKSAEKQLVLPRRSERNKITRK